MTGTKSRDELSGLKDLIDEICRQLDIDRDAFQYAEMTLQRLILDIRAGRYRIDRVKSGAMRQEMMLSRWREARIHLKLAALLEGLPENHYLNLQQRQPGTGNLLTGSPKDANFTGDEADHNASGLIGTRGGAMKPEGAYRAFVVKLIARQIPIEELNTPYAIVAKLARLAGVDVHPTYCRSILLGGRT